MLGIVGVRVCHRAEIRALYVCLNALHMKFFMMKSWCRVQVYITTIEKPLDLSEVLKELGMSA